MFQRYICPCYYHFLAMLVTRIIEHRNYQKFIYPCALAYPE